MNEGLGHREYTQTKKPSRISIEQAEKILDYVEQRGYLESIHPSELQWLQGQFESLKRSNAQSIDLNLDSAENRYDTTLKRLASFLKSYVEKGVLESLPTAPKVEQKKEQESTIEKLRDDIFKQAGTVIFASLPVHQDKSMPAGFAFNYDSRIITAQQEMIREETLVAHSYTKEGEFLKENYITEAVFFIPQLKPRVAITTRQEQYGLFKNKTRDIQEEKITGVQEIVHSEIVQNGVNDSAVSVRYIARGIGYELPYCDYTRRVGQEFNLILSLPKQLADELYKEMQHNPKLIRTIVEDSIKGRSGMAGKFADIVSDKEWREGVSKYESGQEKNPVRPPYEEWANINKGAGRKNKMYMLRVDKSEITFNPETRKPIIRIPLDFQHVKEI
jgi:hypothetical protein